MHHASVSKSEEWLDTNRSTNWCRRSGAAIHWFILRRSFSLQIFKGLQEGGVIVRVPNGPRQGEGTEKWTPTCACSVTSAGGKRKLCYPKILRRHLLVWIKRLYFEPIRSSPLHCAVICRCIIGGKDNVPVAMKMITAIIPRR